MKIRFGDLDGWLKFAFVGMIIQSGLIVLFAGMFVLGLLVGLFGIV